MAILVCLCDLILTYYSGTRYSLGRYCGRSLTLVAAGVVLVAMLAEFSPLKTRAEQDAARLRSMGGIIAGARDAIYSTDRERAITSWNAAAQELYGYSAAEVIGTPLDHLVPSDRADEFRDWSARIAAGGQVNEVETVRRRKNGTTVEVSLTLSPALDADGGVTGVSITARDITERRRAEAQLRRQAIVFNRMTDMVVLLGPDGRVLDCNPAAERITRLSRQVLLGGLAASPELAAAYARCAAVASRLPDDETWTGDLAFPRADGNRAVAESVLVPLCTGDGTLSSLIVVGRDVTAARAAAAALADAERRFTLAFTQAPIGVLLTSLDARNFGRLLSANPALCRMLGYGRTQLLERTLADITHPEDVPQLDAQLQEVLGGARSSLHLEVRQLRADGGALWASISVCCSGPVRSSRSASYPCWQPIPPCCARCSAT